MATEKPFGDEVAFNTAACFAKKKLPNFCLETKQEQQTYNPKDDNCYLKNIC